MRKSVKIRLVCLVVAAFMLSGAVAVAAILGSPYETIKKSLLDAMTYQNATMESRSEIYVNGALVQDSRTYIIMGDNGALSYDFDENGERDGFRFTAGDLTISPAWVAAHEADKWYYAQISPYNTYYSAMGVVNSMIISPEDRNSAQMRFLELLVDLLVGDLKNNITMTSENGIRYIRGTLTANQVPELVKAGIDVLIEQSGSYYGGVREESYSNGSYTYKQTYIDRGIKNVRVWNQPIVPMNDEEKEAWDNGTFYFSDKYAYGVVYTEDSVYPYIATGPQETIEEYSYPATRDDYGYNDDPLSMPLKSLEIDYIKGEAEVDSDGNLLYLKVSGSATITNIFGETSVVEVILTAWLSDIGTSVPVCPIPGAEQLFTEEYFTKHFGYGYGTLGVYFKLDGNGRVDEASITQEFPGRHVTDYDYWTYGDKPSVMTPEMALKYADSVDNTVVTN